jgi:hypothetical protein
MVSVTKAFWIDYCSLTFSNVGDLQGTDLLCAKRCNARHQHGIDTFTLLVNDLFTLPLDGVV